MKKYEKYKNPKDKIKREIQKCNYIKVNRGIYCDEKNLDGYLLVNYIRPLSYLSFEYVLSISGLIPERAYVYTCATSLTKHTVKLKNQFGTYLYTDVPVDVWGYGIKILQENNYTYWMASPEKALCDLLYKKQPIKSVKELESLLFEDLRIDEDLFNNLNFDDIINICDLYKKNNLYYLKKYCIRINKN